MSYLLDTCILSKLRKIDKYPDRDLASWIIKHDENDFFLSVLTIGEIEQGISKLKNQKDKRILEDWFRGDVVARFKGKILNIDLKIASRWGELTGTYQKKGIAIPIIDGLIAATAIVHDLIVVSENIKDFCSIEELKLFSPWER
jgi:toxin FitB